jgi:3',5'-cyclic AMP phosphodiesterase CpdA
MKNISYIILIAALFFSFDGNAKKLKNTSKPKLKFAFMTDVHLRFGNEYNCSKGFQKALDAAKKNNVEFIIFGGDCLDMNEHKTPLERADSLFGAFKSFLDKTPIKTYTAIGNHDRFFNPENGYAEGDELFKKYFKETYYTFEQKGIRFFVLNTVQSGNKPGYHVGEKQMEWLQSQLQNISVETPIVVVTHVPFYSIAEGGFTNHGDVLRAFGRHNLKLVLQGHIHLYEEIYARNIRYISAGAVSSGWWEGTYRGTEEGFLQVEVDNDNNFTWNYVDFKWIGKNVVFK